MPMKSIKSKQYYVGAANKWIEYEMEKSKLNMLNLPSAEYEKRLRALVNRLGI